MSLIHKSYFNKYLYHFKAKYNAFLIVSIVTFFVWFLKVQIYNFHFFGAWYFALLYVLINFHFLAGFPLSFSGSLGYKFLIPTVIVWYFGFFQPNFRFFTTIFQELVTNLKFIVLYFTKFLSVALIVNQIFIDFSFGCFSLFVVKLQFILFGISNFL